LVNSLDKALCRGIFHGVPDLIGAIEIYVAADNENPERFTWTATADQIAAGHKALAATGYRR
jgi:hypothetical protein